MNYTLEESIAHGMGALMCHLMIKSVKETSQEPIACLAGVLASLMVYALQNGATEETLHDQVRVCTQVANDEPMIFEVAGHA